MKTITVQIGNSDDKLTQIEWGTFVLEINRMIVLHSEELHFWGGPHNWAPWQNAAWVFVCSDEVTENRLKQSIHATRQRLNQQSVAWTEGGDAVHLTALHERKLPR